MRGRRKSSFVTILGREVCRGVTVLLGLSFGVGAGAISTFVVLTLILPGPGRDSWGAAPAWFLMMAIGAVLGAILGVIVSVAWTRRPQFKSYTLFEWLGIFVGIAIGVASIQLLPSRFYPYFNGLLMMMVFPVIVSCGRIIVGRLPAMLSATKNSKDQ